MKEALTATVLVFLATLAAVKWHQHDEAKAQLDQVVTSTCSGTGGHINEEGKLFCLDEEGDPEQVLY